MLRDPTCNDVSSRSLRPELRALEGSARRDELSIAASVADGAFFRLVLDQRAPTRAGRNG